MNSSLFGVGKFKSAKCKTLMRLAMARIKLLRNKRDVVVSQMRKDIAQLLSTGQDPSARIRVEHIAREQNIMSAYDMIELFCELIIVRLPIIESNKACPMDLKEAISTLVFASPRCSDLPELLQIRSLFSSKYGKEFVAAALELRPECGVNRRVIEKLSVRAPSGETKLKLLMEIAEEHHVKWDHQATLEELLKKPEDLLDGPKKFFGASDTSTPEPRSSPPKTEEAHPPSVSDPQRATVPPPVRSSSSIARRPTHLSSSPPPPPQKLESPSKPGQSTNAPQFDSSPSNSPRGHDHQARARDQTTHTAPAYDNAAAAAQAAAQSADRAVTAARMAAKLAQTHPFNRPQPPPPSRTVSKGSRRQQSSSSDDDEDDNTRSNRRGKSESMRRNPQPQQQQQQQGRGSGNIYVTSDSYYRNGSSTGYRS
ncbi:unnamed protein product [Calypogeia fissa]